MYRSSLHFLSLAYKTPKSGGVDVNLLNQMNGQQRHSSKGEFSSYLIFVIFSCPGQLNR